MIRSDRLVHAPATVVHALLTDVRAWPIWSPHIAEVTSERDTIDDATWSGAVRPWFGPATTMDVTWVQPGEGMRWTSTALGHRLDYEDLITPHGEDRCTVSMTAVVTGPAGAVLQRAVAPVSAYGQRRRLARLGALAEYLHGRAVVLAR